MNKPLKKIAILGTVGLPARYGGFETLTENLVAQNRRQANYAITVYCSSRAFKEKRRSYLGAKLCYLPLSANGAASVPYDILSLLLAAWRKSDAVLLLGVSGAIALPIFRLISCARVITNVDGLEWKRTKWGYFSRLFLKLSERIAVRFSHEVVADNPAIATYLRETYNRACPVIAYGGEHAIEAKPKTCPIVAPRRYGLAISRIEPENNPEEILKAFAQRPEFPLLYFGNWDATEHGRALKLRFSGIPHLRLLPAEYDAGRLYNLRQNADVYIHGHSTGGTNPSLVEAMHFGRPIIAFDCVFNRHTTMGKALYFSGAESLGNVLDNLDNESADIAGHSMQQIAREHYLWRKVAADYFDLLEGHSTEYLNCKSVAKQHEHPRKSHTL